MIISGNIFSLKGALSEEVIKAITGYFIRIKRSNMRGCSFSRRK